MSSRLLSGRYELLEKIGDGGMAVVYKGKDRLLNRFIAIKILRPEFTKDATFVENFKRESQAAAGLTHPNIVGVYDVGREGNINYIVMELIEGRTLNDIIEDEAPMDYRKVIDISKQVASALKVAHKNKIIHRDVKPHNIMITNDGIVKLADFGIARAVNDATLSTGSKIVGSVHYFSPEQARGNYVDERSDIYSLGIVMYEMLTGKVPFDGENPVTVALKHINEEITPPSELVAGIPPALERCVMKATSKYQTNRYSSAEEMIEELDNISFVTDVAGTSVFASTDVIEKNRKRKAAEEAEEEAAAGRKKKKKKKGKRNAIIAAVIIFDVIMKKTRLGKHIFAVGSNENSARLSGIRVDRVKTIAYMVTGAMCGIAALLYASRMTAVASASAAVGWEMDAIAAVAIGGTRMTGGRGKIMGTFLGVLMFKIISNILTAADVSSYLNGAISALIIVLAVLLQNFQNRNK